MPEGNQVMAGWSGIDQSSCPFGQPAGFNRHPNRHRCRRSWNRWGRTGAHMAKCVAWTSLSAVVDEVGVPLEQEGGG